MDEMPDVSTSEREELIEALQYPTKWRDKGMPTQQVVERATDGHEAAQVVDEYLLPVISRILAAHLSAALARNAELETEVSSLKRHERNRAAFWEVTEQRDALRAELDNLRETLAQKVEAEMRRLQTGSEAPEFDEGMAVAAAIVRGSGDE